MRSKLLKSVAHNWAASFNSTLNYYRIDYGMGHLCRVAVETGKADFEVDLLSGKASPETFLSEAVKYCLAEWLPKFSEILRKEVPNAAVAAAAFRIHFDLPAVVRSSGQAEYRVPCTLTVSIIDGNGKTHVATINENWPVERKSAETGD